MDYVRRRTKLLAGQRQVDCLIGCDSFLEIRNRHAARKSGDKSGNEGMAVHWLYEDQVFPVASRILQ